MGVLEYFAEEGVKLKTNFWQIIASFIITISVYSCISYGFYLVWPFLLSLSDNLFYLRYIGPQVWKLSCVISIQLFLVWVYKTQPKFIEKYRYVEKWPWEEDRKAWNILLKKTLWNYFINQLIISPVMFYAFSFVGKPLRSDIQSWPGIWEIITQVIIFDFINDFLLWATHVLFHWRPLYWIHKVHHEYNDVVSISGEYFHPIEFLVNSMAIVAGPKIYGLHAHMISYFIWQMTRVYDNIVQNHSGYMLPWRPLGICPFQNGNSYHYWHHDRNIGNFSFNYNFWDRMFGFDAKFQEARKAGKVKVM